MRVPDISKSEWTVMEALWERSPQTASEVAKALRPKTNWVENTVRTLLKRLVKKRALEICASAGAAKTFAPIVKREDCVRAEGESFMQRIFRGAPNPLLIHFATKARLTRAEVKELKKLLDQSIDQ